MGKRLKAYFQWAVFCLVVLLATYGSRGSISHFLEEFFRRSHALPIARRVILQSTSGTPSTATGTRLQPSEMLGPSVHPSDRPVKIGFDVSSSPEISPVLPPVEERAPSPVYPVTRTPTPITSPKGFASHPPIVLPPKLEDVAPTIQAVRPPIPSNAPSVHVSVEHKHPRSTSTSTESQAPGVPAAQIRRRIPVDGGRTPQGSPAITLPHVPGPALSPTCITPVIPGKSYGMPVAAPPKETSKGLPPVNCSHSRGTCPTISPAPYEAKGPLNNSHAPPISHQPHPKERVPNISSAPHEAKKPSNTTQAPFVSHSQPPEGRILHNPVSVPTISVHQHISRKSVKSPLIAPSYTAPLASHLKPPTGRISQTPASAPMVSTRKRTSRKRVGNPAAAPLSPPPPSSHYSGHVFSPSPLHPPEAFPKNSQRHHASPPHSQGPSLSPTQGPFSSNDSELVPVPSPSPMTPSSRHEWSHSPVISPSGSFSGNPRAPAPQAILAVPPPPNLGPTHSPLPSPSGSFSRNPRTPEPQPVRALPPPPPYLDCTSLLCSDPLTNTPPGSPCVCVLPIKVGLRLSIALYTFFPLVSELAQEIASGVFMKQSQVRIMGANAADEDPEKTIVLLDLVPLGYTYDNTTAFLTYEKFWHKQIPIKASFFGDYDVLYVIYPGLPPSPPTAPADISSEDGTFGNGNNGRAIKPLGVDVRKQKDKLNGSLIAIIVLSSVIVLVLIAGAAWLLLLRHGDHTSVRTTPQTLLPPFAKSSGTGPTILGSRPSSASASFGSSIGTYTGSAKTFTLAEIERATKSFADSRIIGEGGFGRVYQGTLEDGTRVAVKVLKRDDQQGGREFLAEVEMLGRLHHRNLVKLIGICTEDIRCLVYELIPNGSLESHLHGVDKDTAPLDWSARMKIALGAARGLSYLHEDSSPRVIHRDFKSSNILLENDYTPKVSDFGLARTALDEGNEHISTRVMGTFGYVAPEYAMTGHLLVKSDVYSYGVVLLELLTGRKPVDMLQPPGQENLVTWARPLLTSKEGLETIIDPALGTNYPFDSVAKVAAIASMCVQPEVSHRPFMGEVVQALKLVCNMVDDYKGSESCSQDYSSAQDKEIRISVGFGLESERMLSASDIFSTSARFTRDASGSFRQHSSSGPLTTGKGRQYWQRVRGLSRGSMSEHGLSLKSGGLEGGEEWP